jgi:hypothetical protein
LIYEAIRAKIVGPKRLLKGEARLKSDDLQIAFSKFGNPFPAKLFSPQTLAIRTRANFLFPGVLSLEIETLANCGVQLVKAASTETRVFEKSHFVPM